MLQSIIEFLNSTGIAALIENAKSGFAAAGSGFEQVVAVIGTPLMIIIACVLLYLAIVKEFEPLLLLPIAFGMLLSNLPMFSGSGAIMMHPEFFTDPQYLVDGHLDMQRIFAEGGLLDMLYLGVKLGIYPPLIFLGIGCMTDFGPLIANPKSILLGAAAQLGVFTTFLGALALGAIVPGINFGVKEASSIGIIGGADGPTAIYVTKTLAPALLPAIAIAAYSYMALVPIVQPPVIRALTTTHERRIRMPYHQHTVSRRTKILFPIIITAVCGIVSPRSVALVGFLMFGNLIRVCGVLDSLSETAQKTLSNLITLFLGLTIAVRMQAEYFLTKQTLLIMALIFDTAGGVLVAKVINLFLPKEKKLNPMIGACGISAFPMSARVVYKMAIKEDPQNYLLMQCVGVNVSGQVASVIAGGLLLNLLV